MGGWYGGALFGGAVTHCDDEAEKTLRLLQDVTYAHATTRRRR